MVACVLDGGWTIEATAERFQVDAKTVRKWRDRFLAEGDDGSVAIVVQRPHVSPNRTRRRAARRVLQLRRQAPLGRRPHRPRARLAPPRRCSRSSSRRAAAGSTRGDRAIADSRCVRYQRERPGELVHVDVKKIAGIPDGGGWRIHGRGQAPPSKRSTHRLPLHPLRPR